MTYGSQQSFLLVGKESTQGTGVTADKDLGIIKDLAPRLDRELKIVETVGAVEDQAILAGNSSVGFSSTIEFQHGRILEMALGTVAHAQTSSDWKHTFTINSSNLSTWTMDGSYDGSTDTKFRQLGNMIESLEIGIELNGNLTGNCTWKGLSTSSSATIGTKAISTLITFPHSLVTVEFDDVVVPEVQQFSVTIENTVVPVYGLGSTIAQGLNRTRTSFKFAGKLGFSSKSYLELAQGGATLAAGNPTAFAVELIASNGVTLGSGRRDFYIKLSNCVFNQFEKAVSVGDLVFCNVAGQGTLTECYSTDNISSASW